MVDRGGSSPAVVLTLRSAELRAHGGQWSFPGGRIDEGDRDAVAAALRESHEEIGVDPAAVEVLGLLHDVPTSTGFLVTPVVGWLDPAPAAFRPNPAEVTEVWEAPLSLLVDPSVTHVELHGTSRPIYSYSIEERTVWGATARILVELSALLGGA